MTKTFTDERLINFNNHLRLAANSLAAQNMELTNEGDLSYGEADVYGDTVSIDVYALPDQEHLGTIEDPKAIGTDEDIAALVLEAAEEVEYDLVKLEDSLKKRGITLHG